MLRNLGVVVFCFALFPGSAKAIRNEILAGDVVSVQAIIDQDPGIVNREIVIQHPFNGEHRCYSLHLAANRGDLAITQLLLAHNADAGALDSNGRTPLQIAQMAQPQLEDYQAIAALLGGELYDAMDVGQD